MRMQSHEVTGRQNTSRGDMSVCGVSLYQGEGSVRRDVELEAETGRNYQNETLSKTIFVLVVLSGWAIFDRGLHQGTNMILTKLYFVLE